MVLNDNKVVCARSGGMVRPGETLKIRPRSGHSQLRLNVYAADGSQAALDRLAFTALDYTSAMQLMTWLSETDTVSGFSASEHLLTINVCSNKHLQRITFSVCAVSNSSDIILSNK